MAQKRFKTLYKNLIVNDRAVKGFAGLTAELQLKAEEVIHQLNDDSSLVTIKRKVFGKKNRETVLEVIFAYKGRLYFRKSKEHGTEVMAIGTKHTQGKDLGFLDNLWYSPQRHREHRELQSLRDIDDYSYFVLLYLNKHWFNISTPLIGKYRDEFPASRPA